MNRMDEDEFKYVTYGRKRIQYKKNAVKFNLENELPSTQSADPPKIDSLIKRILELKTEITSSTLLQSVVAAFNEARSLLETERKIKTIVCLGIGRLSQCYIAKNQFALLLLLKEHFNCAKTQFYDPILNDTEKLLIQHFECDVLTENLEGKYKIEREEPTIDTDDEGLSLFFLPHCPKLLSNNLLLTNWSRNLQNCIIFANSFGRIIEHQSRSSPSDTIDNIIKIGPYTEEYKIEYSKNYAHIFNDLSLHVFPLHRHVLDDAFFTL